MGSLINHSEEVSVDSDSSSSQPVTGSARRNAGGNGKRWAWVDLTVVRVIFVVLISSAAYHLHPFHLAKMYAAAFGVVLGLSIVLLEDRLRRTGLKRIIGAVIGALAGILCAYLMALVLRGTPIEQQSQSFLQVAMLLGMSYLGMVIGAKKGELLNLHASGLFRHERGSRPDMKILDTSVVIDGRIIDIGEAGFLDGILLLPQFMLRELQMVADSSDSMKRNRGRRGLDVLQRLRKLPGLETQVVETDYPHIREVDLKLIEMARQYEAKIITNDFNLNKVAQLQGVEVLNINELANALKPVVLPGECMRIFILKEGKEPGQGVGYLDDGTMVVVDHARHEIGKTVDITVTSVLQTTAGKMIFGRFGEGANGDPPQPPRERDRVHATSFNSAPASGGSQRRGGQPQPRHGRRRGGPDRES